MVRRKKIETDSSIKTGNDELSMVTEIETAPENLSADELEKEFPIMTLRTVQQVTVWSFCFFYG